ncbi:hypothetical protein TNCT_334261, partial [Trichonephila clavata]
MQRDDKPNTISKYDSKAFFFHDHTWKFRGKHKQPLHELPANHSRDPFTPLGESGGTG